MEHTDGEGMMAQLTSARTDTINIREIIEVILSKNLSLNFQKNYGVPRINFKKRDEKIRHQTKEMIRDEGIRAFLNRMHRSKLYLSRYGSSEISKYLKNHYQIKPNARRIVSLPDLAAADRDRRQHGPIQGVLQGTADQLPD
jgi:hypothetical protein